MGSVLLRDMCRNPSCYREGKPTFYGWLCEEHEKEAAMENQRKQTNALPNDFMQQAIGNKLAKAFEQKNSDDVNHPSHYNSGGIEVIDAIEAWELDRNFRLANVVKYVARHAKKSEDLDVQIKDLEKARFYLDREIKLRKEKLYGNKVVENVCRDGSKSCETLQATRESS